MHSLSFYSTKYCQIKGTSLIKWQRSKWTSKRICELHRSVAGELVHISDQFSGMQQVISSFFYEWWYSRFFHVIYISFSFLYVYPVTKQNMYIGLHVCLLWMTKIIKKKKKKKKSFFPIGFLLLFFLSSFYLCSLFLGFILHNFFLFI